MLGELRKNIKKPINILFMLVNIFLMLGLFIFVHVDQFETFQEQNRKESARVQGALSFYESLDAVEGSTAYQNILLQKSELAKQLNGILFDKAKNYIEASLELTKHQEVLRSDPNFTDELALLQPKEEIIQKNQLYFTYLREHPKEIILKPETVSTLILLFLSILGFIWFPMCSFVSANILEDEFEHPSLTKGQPNTFSQRLVKKVLAIYLLLFSSILLAIILGAVLAFFIGNPTNDLMFGNVIQVIHFRILQNWQVIVVYLLYLSVVFLFTLSLSACLNLLTKNFYLTLMIENTFFGVSLLLTNQVKDFPMYLGSYLIPTQLFDGAYLGGRYSALYNPVVGLAYLLVMSTVLLWGTSLLYQNKSGQRGRA